MNIVNSVKNTAKKAAFWVNKHSPELLIGGGIIGFGGAIVCACIATLKTKDDIDLYEYTIEDIGDTIQIESINPETNKNELMPYTDDMKVADTKKAKTKLVLNVAKHYAPAVILGSAATVSIISSNRIMRKRALAIAAALSATETAFAAYRENVREKYGEEMDKNFLYGVKTKEIEETEIVNGKEKTVKKEETTIDLGNKDGYTVTFDSDSDYWDENTDYNMMFLRTVEHELNTILDTCGHVYLNEAFRKLGVEETAIGQVIGWTKDVNDVNDPTRVMLELFDTSSKPFVNIHDHNKPILVKFNPQGYILDKMNTKNKE